MVAFASRFQPVRWVSQRTLPLMGKRDVTAAGPLRGDSLRTGSAPFPWEQFVDLRVGVIGYAADDVAKPSLGVDVAQASGLDKRVYDSGAAAAFIRAGDQIAFSSEGPEA
jgi:hypothetical protein